LLLKEGKVVACGNYEEITKTGFNIKDILDTFLSANEVKKADKNKSPEKPKEKQKSEPLVVVKAKPQEITKELDEVKKDKPKSTVKLTADEIDHPPVGFKEYRDFFAFSAGLPGMALFLVIAILASIM